MADAAHVQRPKGSLGALSVGLGRVLARCEPVCCQAGAKMGQNGPKWAKMGQNSDPHGSVSQDTQFKSRIMSAVHPQLNIVQVCSISLGRK